MVKKAWFYDEYVGLFYAFCASFLNTGDFFFSFLEGWLLWSEDIDCQACGMDF